MKKLLLIITVCIVGFVIYESQKSPKSLVPPTSVTVVAPLQLPQIIADIPSVMYRDPEHGFALYYPSTALLKVSAEGQYLPLTHSPVIAFTLSPGLFEGTNLDEAGIYIGATTTLATVANCTSLSLQAGETLATSSMMIGDTAFAVFYSRNVTAKNTYEEKIFRTINNATCFEIVELLRSSQISAHTSSTTSAFDGVVFSKILDAMVNTFVFKR